MSCDRRSLGEIESEDVAPYYPMEPVLDSSRARLAPWTLVDKKNPFVRRPRRCIVKENGRSREIALSWMEKDRAAVEALVLGGQFGRPPELGLTSLGNGVQWASIPSFGPAGAQANVMERLIEQIRGLREVRLLVFDVRGNSGGNSEWGKRLFEAAFGRRPHEKSSAVDWRVSAGNLEHLRFFLPQLRERFGQDSPMVREFGRVEAGMVKALERGEDLYREPPGLPEAAPSAAAVKSPPAKVVLLTDGRCGSACLDFADILLAEKIVVHAGLPTAADTDYMELRVLDLPSGIGKLALPIKVYRGRARKANQAYVPAHVYGGDIADTDAVRSWLFELLR